MTRKRSAPRLRLDLNTATAAQLEKLEGLSPELAVVITQYGAEHGRWTSIEQLLDIPGMTSAQMDALRPLLCILPEPETTSLDEPEPTPLQGVDVAVEEAALVVPEEEAEAVLPSANDVPEVEATASVSGSAESQTTAVEAPELEIEAADSGAVRLSDQVSEDGELDGTSEADLTAELSEPAATDARVPEPGESEVGSDEGVLSEAVSDGAAALQPVVMEDGPAPGLVDLPAAGEAQTVSLSEVAPLDKVTGENSENAATDLPVADGAETKVDSLEDAGVKAPEKAKAAADEASASDDQPRTLPGVPPPQEPPRRKRLWHDAGMVALGGLLGALLTLLVLGGLGGTLSYAPRRLVDALSENMSTMQANQETSWEQMQAQAARVDTLEEQVAAMDGLQHRVTALETGSVALETQLTQLDEGLTRLTSDVMDLESRHAALIKGLDTRLGVQETEFASLGETVGALGDTVQTMKDQVDKYQAFFDALRDLLIDMQGTDDTDQGA